MVTMEPSIAIIWVPSSQDGYGDGYGGLHRCTCGLSDFSGQCIFVTVEDDEQYEGARTTSDA